MQIRGKEYVNHLKEYGVTAVEVEPLVTNPGFAEVRVEMNSKMHRVTADVSGSPVEYHAKTEDVLRRIIADNYEKRLDIPSVKHTHSYTADPMSAVGNGRMVCNVCLARIGFDSKLGIWVNIS